MRSFSAVLLLAATASVSATTLLRRQSPYPDCALPCLSAAMEGNDCAGDLVCLCNSEAFVSGTTDCIATSCEGSDLETANSVARGSCASVGVNLEEPTDEAPNAEESDSAPAPSDSETAPETSATPEDQEDEETPAGAALSTGANTLLTLTAVGLVSLVL